ncbi:hypothetical protein GCM10023238_30970 [Streptomyces heliomycini]
MATAPPIWRRTSATARNMSLPFRLPAFPAGLRKYCVYLAGASPCAPSGHGRKGGEPVVAAVPALPRIDGMAQRTVLVVLFDGVQSLDVTGPVEVFAGDEHARTVQLLTEYDPQPPYDAGSPRKAPAHLVEEFRAKSRLILT